MIDHEALAVLLDDAANLPLNEFGQIALHNAIGRAHANAAAAGRAGVHPRTAPVRALVIASLPRTGSTFLHSVLDRVPGLRAPRYAESRLPFADDTTAHRYAADVIDVSYRYAPGLREMHPLGEDEPEEFRVLLEHTLRSHSFAVQFPVLRYSEHVDEHVDFEPMLEILAHLDREPWWVLKDPAYLRHTGDLARALDDARVWWLHRDPVDVLPSACSLIHMMWSASGVEFPKEALGPLVMAKLAGEVDLARRGLVAVDVVHVQYAALASAPAATITAALERSGLPTPGPELARSLDAGGGTYKPRQLDLAEWGLTTAAIHDAFESYYDWSV